MYVYHPRSYSYTLLLDCVRWPIILFHFGQIHFVSLFYSKEKKKKRWILTTRSMKMRASRRFVVRLYRTSQVPLARRFSQIRVSINPRYIFGWTASVLSQYQSRTASSRGVILGQLTYIITAKLMLSFRWIVKRLSYSYSFSYLLGKGR